MLYPPLQNIETPYRSTPVHLQVYDGECAAFPTRLSEPRMPRNCACFTTLLIYHSCESSHSLSITWIFIQCFVRLSIVTERYYNFDCHFEAKLIIATDRCVHQASYSV